MTREFIIVFADVVRYSVMTNDVQEDVIKKLTQIVETVHPGRDLRNRDNGLFLATGDGFAAAFSDELVHNHPEEILTFARELHRGIASIARLRIGIHRGPARSYADFNARFSDPSTVQNNLAGAAVNLSQRVMSLADPGDILVTDSFYRHYVTERGRDEASRLFRSMGSIRVKHGEELEVFNFDESERHRVPARIGSYATAQKEIFRALRQIRQKVEWTVYGQPKATLEARAALFLYDSVGGQLFLTAFREGAGLDRLDPVPDLRFGLDEGPGVVFKQAMDEKRFRSGYHELPSPPPKTLVSEWIPEASRELRIPPEKISNFSRPSACYLYLSVHFGGHGHPPLGVVSVDLLRHIFSRTEIMNALRRDKHVRKRDVQQLAHERIVDRLEKLERRLNPLLQRIATAYAVINTY